MGGVEQWVPYLWYVVKVCGIAAFIVIAVLVVVSAVGWWIAGRRSPVAPDWMDDEHDHDEYR